MSVLRAFIAIELPATIQDAIQKQTTRLRAALGDDLIRWIPSHNIHLTLKFLGDIAPSHVDFLKQMLARETEAFAPFDVQISGLGCFPSSKRPRVIWTGLHAPAVLASIHRNMEAATARLGYEKEERPFSPHLTIGRVKQNPSTADLQKIRLAVESTQLGSIGTARVDSMVLFRSDLKPTGAVYTKLFSAKFKPDPTALQRTAIPGEDSRDAA